MYKFLLSMLLVATMVCSVNASTASYDASTGEIVVTVTDVNNWFIQSNSSGLTGDVPNLLGNGLASDNDQIIGETAFGLFSFVDLNLGAVADVGLPVGDVTLNYNEGLGSPLITYDVDYGVPAVPEPSTFALAMFAMVGIFFCRRLQ